MRLFAAILVLVSISLTVACGRRESLKDQKQQQAASLEGLYESKADREKVLQNRDMELPDYREYEVKNDRLILTAMDKGSWQVDRQIVGLIKEGKGLSKSVVPVENLAEQTSGREHFKGVSDWFHPNHEIRLLRNKDGSLSLTATPKKGGQVSNILLFKVDAAKADERIAKVQKAGSALSSVREKLLGDLKELHLHEKILLEKSGSAPEKREVVDIAKLLEEETSGGGKDPKGQEKKANTLINFKRIKFLSKTEIEINSQKIRKGKMDLLLRKGAASGGEESFVLRLTLDHNEPQTTKVLEGDLKIEDGKLTLTQKKSARGMVQTTILVYKVKSPEQPKEQPKEQPAEQPKESPKSPPPEQTQELTPQQPVVPPQLDP